MRCGACRRQSSALIGGVCRSCAGPSYKANLAWSNHDRRQATANAIAAKVEEQRLAKLTPEERRRQETLVKVFNVLAVFGAVVGACSVIAIVVVVLFKFGGPIIATAAFFGIVFFLWRMFWRT